MEPDEETGVNTAMTQIADRLNDLMQAPVVAKNSAQTASYLDVVGYNYMESRFGTDGELYPNRVIVGSETHPAAIDTGWAAVRRHSYVIGDFTWTGWDYLGEGGHRAHRLQPTGWNAGDARPSWASTRGARRGAATSTSPVTVARSRTTARSSSDFAPSPTSPCSGPSTTVRSRPGRRGPGPTSSRPGAGPDSEGAPVTVEVYADADEVELVVNGRSVGRQPSGEEHRYRSAFETTYEPGVVEAVAFRDGAEIGRTAMPVRRGAGAAWRPPSTVPSITADPEDLAFVTLRLVDEDGVLHVARDSEVEVEIEGPAVLAALGSANPVTEEGFNRDELHHLRRSRPGRSSGPPVKGASRCGPRQQGCETAAGRDRCPVPESAAGAAVTWELRWHPFRGQWVLFTSHRDARPWIGEVVAPEEPPVPDDNALAPLGRRLHGTNPDYRGVYVFTNDLPVFSPEAPEPEAGDDLYRTRRALGTAEVVCYHDDPTRSMADLTDDEMAAIVTTWRDRTAALQAHDGVAHVLIFENRGAMVGTSNPHPHCQIYAGAMVYATMAREAEVAREYQRRTGRSLLAEVVEREVDGPRVISEGEHFFACVPWFAQYAYEVHILPRRPATSLVDLDQDQCRSLALVLRDVVRRYDALWGFRLPYVLAVHQAPVGDHPHYPFHLELHPPLRSPGIRKYLAGPEVGGGSMTNESDPDQKAEELRAALA